MMKLKILYLLFFVSNFILAQGPTDYVKRYDFTNDDFTNLASPGTNNMIKTGTNNYTLTADRNGNGNSALDISAFGMNSGSYSATFEEYTFSFWVNLSYSDNSYREIMRQFNNNRSGNSGGIAIIQQSGGIRAAVDVVNSGIASAATTSSISDGNWHHITVVVDKEVDTGRDRWRVTLYLDGVQESTATTPYQSTNANRVLFNGNRISQWTQVQGASQFIGKLDDIKIWTRPLNIYEVQSLSGVSPTDDVLSYNFNQGSYNSTGSIQNHLSLNNGVAPTVVIGQDGNAMSALESQGNTGLRSAGSGTGRDNMTVSFFMKTNVTNGNYNEIIQNTVASSPLYGGIVGHGVSTLNSGVEAILRATCNNGDCNSQPITRVSGGVVNDNNWHHIAYSIEKIITGSNTQFEIKLYVDGVIVNSTQTPLVANSKQPKFNIAGQDFRLFQGGGNFFRGALDDVRVFGRKLDVSEIQLLSNVTILPPRDQYFVDANASGANNGTSWADAYISLEDALVGKNDKEFWVAAGTYKPSSRTSSFKLAKTNRIYGGFNGTETALEQRNSKANITILSGDLNNDDTGVSLTGNNRGDNAYNVIRVISSNITIDGFTIQDGYANGATESIKQGSAIYINTGVANTTIKNCILKNNVSLGGGAIRAVDVKGFLNIENTIATRNLAKFASVLYTRGQAGQVLNVNITNCVVHDNVVNDTSNSRAPGSAIWLRQDSNATQNVKVVNSTFVGNNFFSNSVATSSVINASRNGSGKIFFETSNSIFYYNFSNTNTDLRSVGNSQSNFRNVVLSANNCIARDNLDQIPASNKTNVVNSVPDFTNVSTKDFTLKSTSPAIDIGNNSKVPTNIKTDILGNLRIFNSIVDLGAYEFGSSAPVNRTLTITATNGTVTTNPNPVNGTYDDGTIVTLTATPNNGYQFDGWSGDVTGTTNPLSVTMDADKTITALFSKIQRTLTITATNGTVTTNPNPVNGIYDDGTVVTLTATPDNGYQFDGWSGDATSTTNPLSITMDADKTVTALFSKIQRTLTITATNGTVTTNPKPVNGTYDDGTVITITAIPDSNFGFVEWTEDLTGNSIATTITMDADKSITANFSATASVNNEKFLENNFNIYPNPTKDIVTIESDLDIVNISIYNVLGQKVMLSNKKVIKISNLDTGIYMLVIETREGKRVVKKMMKK